MPTPKFICGAECGIAAVGTLSVGIEHWSTSTGTPPSISTTTFNSAGGGIRSLRFNVASPNQCFLGHVLLSQIISPAAGVARFYVYFASMPTATTQIFTFDDAGSGSYGSVRYNVTTGKLVTRALSVEASDGIAVTTGVWYRIDFKVVTGTTVTADMKVNGVDATQASSAGSAAALAAFRVGFFAGGPTADMFIDDLIISGTTVDYPIGPGGSVGLYPNGDKTSSAAAGVDDGAWGHRYSAVTVFGKGAAGATNLAAQNAESTSWQSLANPLSASIGTNFIAAKTGTTIADHLTWTLPDLPSNASVLNGVMITAATHTASATTATFALTITRATGASFTVQGGSDFSEATITLPTFFPYLLGGGVGTIADVNAAQLTFWSTDTNPDVYLDGIVMEVDYVPLATPTTSISPAIFTLAPVALTAVGSGDAARTLTSAALTLSPIALVRSVGTATTSISPVTVTLNPTLLTGQATIDPQFTSISPVAMTLSPQPVARSVGGVSGTVSPVTISLSPVALTRSVGGVSTSITSVTMALSPVTLVRSVGGITTSVSPAIFTMTAVAVTRTLGTASTSLSSVTVTLNAVTLAYSVGDTARTLTSVTLTLTPVALTGESVAPNVITLTPVIFTLTPIALTRSVGAITTVISPVTLTFNAVAITRTLGTASTTLSPAIFTLTSVALTRSVGGTTRSITPVTLTFTAFVITGFAATPGTGNIVPVVFTLSPVALTRSIGGVTTSVVPTILTLVPITLTASSVAPVGGKPKVWTGTEWVEKPVKVWTGTVWVEKPMKVWTGSEWELV